MWLRRRARHRGGRSSAVYEDGSPTMWDWLRRRARHRRSRSSAVDEGGSPYCPDVARDGTRPLRSSAQPFFVPTLQMGSSPPKCLSRLPCSEILYGARLEDFSTDCWLEDHLHRFGGPTSQLHRGENTPQSPSSQIFDDEESVTGSSESNDTTTDYSNFDMDIYDTLEMARENRRPRLALEELFVPPSEQNVQSFDLAEPPPYSQIQFPDDPPPSYEEAIGREIDRRSNGTRSSSSSMAFIW